METWLLHLKHARITVLAAKDWAHLDAKTKKSQPGTPIKLASDWLWSILIG
jgi:hypothetical protein